MWDSEANRPTTRLLALFRRKWIPSILRMLRNGRVRHCRLHKDLGITKKVLGEALRELITSGFVERHKVAGGAVLTEYSLTMTGRRLLEPLDLLDHWGLRNPEIVERLSRQRDHEVTATSTTPQVMPREAGSRV